LEFNFNSLLPAIAFALDMFRETDNNFGVNEVLLSSVLAAVMFAIFAGQPLVMVGVTGNSASKLRFRSYINVSR
jgi:hypothetical protein